MGERKMIIVKLAYYRKEDWKRFINVIDDRESIHDNWYDWHKAIGKLKRDLKRQGFEIVDIVVDLDELIEYCKLRGIKNDVNARSRFVQER